MTDSRGLKSRGLTPPAGLPLLWLILPLVATGLFLLSLGTGSVAIAPGEVMRALLDALSGEEPASAHARIILSFRLPKALTALLAGAALAVSGLLMQTLFRNPLAGPYVLGISAGASLGVALVVLGAGGFGASLALNSGLANSGIGGHLALIVAAGVGAAGSLLIVILAARRVSVLSLLILGVLFGFATNALVTILIHFSLPEQIRAYMVWTFGSFMSVTWPQLALLAIATFIGLGLAFLAAKPLDALLLGEDAARGLGVSVRQVRTLVLVATALLAGSVTAFCGPVGFLGVAVPHLARGLLRRAEHRLLLPTTALAGACTALAADILAQLPGSAAILPLNAVTALVGAPVIAAIVLKRRALEASFS